MIRRFEWSEHKARSNFLKHRVRFVDAARVFADPFHQTSQDRVEHGEIRWQTIGSIDNVVLVLVAHTLTEEVEHGELVEVIRVISARRATRRERRQYEQG